MCQNLFGCVKMFYPFVFHTCSLCPAKPAHVLRTRKADMRYISVMAQNFTRNKIIIRTFTSEGFNSTRRINDFAFAARHRNGYACAIRLLLTQQKMPSPTQRDRAKNFMLHTLQQSHKKTNDKSCRPHRQEQLRNTRAH